MIHSEKVKDAVEHQDLDFGFEAVPPFASLSARAAERNGEVAEGDLTTGAPVGEREREDIGRVVL